MLASLIMIVLATTSAACRRGGTMIDLAAAATKTPTAAPATPDPGTPVDVRRFHALLINGGGNPTQNYQSHHLHVATLVDRLRGSGLPADHIALFASDGADPAADMAVRDKQPEANFWMLRGTPLEEPLRTPVTRIDAKLAGITAAPATKAALTQWFAGARTRLRPGDTLLLYVTDHATGSPDGRNNAIVLWGAGQSLTVDDLGQLLATLDPGVRVVGFMSLLF
jgi:hypothetical protein